jgi:hypothetical protein
LIAWHFSVIRLWFVCLVSYPLIASSNYSGVVSFSVQRMER